jgi:hypothetical protein
VIVIVPAASNITTPPVEPFHAGEVIDASEVLMVKL